MWYLYAAVAFVGVLCVMDLILSLGIIRRLREHTAQLEKTAGPPGTTTTAVGTPVGEFTATTVSGTVVRKEDEEPQRLFAFVAPGCGACADQLPAFIRYAAGYPGHTVTVVIHSADGAEEYVARLKGVAEVVVEPQDGPVGKAFQVGGYPTWVLIDASGVVLAGGMAIDRITVPALR